MNPNGKVFKVIKFCESSVLLEYGKEIFECKNVRIKNVPEPMFKIGDCVIVSYSGEIGFVREIYWHYQMNVPFYYLTIDNKKKSRRYLDSELSLK